MYIKLVGLYHLDPNNPKYSSYYRKQGAYCFDFTHNKDFASDLTEREAQHVLQYKEHYCKMYGASKMVVEE